MADASDMNPNHTSVQLASNAEVEDAKNPDAAAAPSPKIPEMAGYMSWKDLQQICVLCGQWTPRPQDLSQHLGKSHLPQKRQAQRDLPLELTYYITSHHDRWQNE